MPRMNGTGPAGQGPLTGRGQGLCGIPGLNRSQAISQQSSSWFGRLLQGVLGGFGLGTYSARRGSGRGMGGFRGQGQGRRRSF
jgi:hypothetical protein